MAGTEWVTTEQKAFLQELYSEFLKAQLHSTLSAFWTEVYRGWFEKWPEISVIYPDVPNHESLTDEQKKTLGVAVKKRQQQLRTWFNYRSQRSGRASVNAMTKSIHKMFGNKAKGTRVHTPAEIFLSNHGAEVQNKLQDAIDAGSIMTKGEKLTTARKLALEAYTAASPEVQASCLAAVQAEHDAKASAVLRLKGAPEDRTNAERAKALEECTGPIAHFLQAIHEMTGFHWTIMGAGPDPRYNGDINVTSFHTGVNEYGQNWMQATPDFNERHLKPFAAFVSHLFPESTRKTHALSYVPPTPSQEDTALLAAEQLAQPGIQLPSPPAPVHPGRLSVPDALLPDTLLSFNTTDDFDGSSDHMGLSSFSSSSGGSNYIHLPAFDMNKDRVASTSTGSGFYPSDLMPSSRLGDYLSSPSSPMLSWNQDAHYGQNYSLPPFVASPKFNFPLLSVPAGSSLEVPHPTTDRFGAESPANTAVTVETPNILQHTTPTTDHHLADAESRIDGELTTENCSDHSNLAPAIVTVDAVVPPVVKKSRCVARVAATVDAAADVPPAIRKTGHVRMETTRLTQANNIGQSHMKRARAAGPVIASGPPKKCEFLFLRLLA
ncbi:hypothetical protein CY34DRAFT_18965 [Suillus luteus UH-Slu-Lm8-n1]|uniref:Uncharacterized protein n=1 Tax=Suillus luteus UH-Slu-Lm8-n1 TaxID=930992 RepID=A0A0D0AKY9_9AGAM|nr:hypothetical protein CY34DRAFT_18965 [Suillus luteus UH-Slu-Lm8-n1]